MMMMESHRQKTTLVTGGTDGVGKAIARTLVQIGHRIIIVGRDDAKGRLAEQELRASSPNGRVDFIRADLSLIRDVDRLGEMIVERWASLDNLILNAGVIHGARELTDEGLERMFATNFLGRFELTRAVLPLLNAAGRRDDPAHVLFVSGAARGGRISYDDPSLRSRFNLISAVRQFCLANDLFALSLAQAVHESSASGRISISCLKLGVVETNIRRHFPWWMNWIVSLVMDPLFGQTSEEAAISALRAIRESSPNDPTVVLFTKIRRFKHLSPDDRLLDREEWTRLWNWSDQLAKTARDAGRISGFDDTSATLVEGRRSKQGGRSAG